MFPHCTASATKLRPQTGPENRSGKRPALLLRTLLLAALLLSGIRCALAQPRIGIAYCDLDHLYDTIPALFYDDSDYTPGGRLAWDTERSRRKIARTAAVIDSMRMPLVALWSVENEAVVRDIAAAWATTATCTKRSTRSTAWISHCSTTATSSIPTTRSRGAATSTSRASSTAAANPCDGDPDASSVPRAPTP